MRGRVTATVSESNPVRRIVASMQGDRVAGKVAIVTGAGSRVPGGVGNGRATSVLLARQGARVALVDTIREWGEVANTTYNGLPAEGVVGVFAGGDLTEVSLEWLIVGTPNQGAR
jgi:NAD(P)-dependent dehydrogenase (short-subunit alcohol dehydrogenase family)